MAGQFDHHEEGTLLAYERLNPAVKAQSRLIPGSWNHSSQITPLHVPHEHNLDYDVTTDQFSWFHSILVDGVVPQGEVRVYNIEEDKWMQLDSWPIEPKEVKTMYLTAQSCNGRGRRDAVYLRTQARQSSPAGARMEGQCPVVITIF